MGWLFGREKKDPKGEREAARAQAAMSREERVINALVEKFPQHKGHFSREFSHFEPGAVAGEGHYHIVSAPNVSRQRLEELGLRENEDYTKFHHEAADGARFGLVEFAIKEKPLEQALGIPAQGRTL